MNLSSISRLAILAIAAGFFSSPPDVSAASPNSGRRLPTVHVYDANGNKTSEFLAYDRGFRGGVRVAVGDTDGDGQPEIVTAPGRGGGPDIHVYSMNGVLRSRFFAYAEGFRGGVNVAVGDLDDDGRAEIVTGPGSGGGPEVKIFDSLGNRLRSFMAYDEKFRGGVNVSVGPFGRRGEPRIVTGSGVGSGHIRLFDFSGRYTGPSLRPFGSTQSGVTVAAIRADGERTKVLAGVDRQGLSDVRLVDLDTESSSISFQAYGQTFRGGVRVASGDLDGDGNDEVITGSGPGGGPHVRVFDRQGTAQLDVMAYEPSFRGGVSVAGGSGIFVTGPGAIDLDGRTDLIKYIEVDLSDQTLKYFQEGKRVGTHRVSTGKWDTPTPIGSFAIKNKIPNAYSKVYDLYMEWWMAFTPDGSYGVHALPYWALSGGGKRYEGVNHLGSPASHGCIRQTLAEAKKLYRWADVGTTVIVKK